MEASPNRRPGKPNVRGSYEFKLKTMDSQFHILASTLNDLVPIPDQRTWLKAYKNDHFLDWDCWKALYDEMILMHSSLDRGDLTNLVTYYDFMEKKPPAATGVRIIGTEICGVYSALARLFSITDEHGNYPSSRNCDINRDTIDDASDVDENYTVEIEDMDQLREATIAILKNFPEERITAAQLLRDFCQTYPTISYVLIKTTQAYECAVVGQHISLVTEILDLKPQKTKMGLLPYTRRKQGLPRSKSKSKRTQRDAPKVQRKKIVMGSTKKQVIEDPKDRSDEPEHGLEKISKGVAKKKKKAVTIDAEDNENDEVDENKMNIPKYAIMSLAPLEDEIGMATFVDIDSPSRESFGKHIKFETYAEQWAHLSDVPDVLEILLSRTSNAYPALINSASEANNVNMIRILYRKDPSEIMWPLIIFYEIESLYYHIVKYEYIFTAVQYENLAMVAHLMTLDKVKDKIAEIGVTVIVGVLVDHTRYFEDENGKLECVKFLIEYGKKTGMPLQRFCKAAPLNSFKKSLGVLNLVGSTNDFESQFDDLDLEEFENENEHSGLPVDILRKMDRFSLASIDVLFSSGIDIETLIIDSRIDMHSPPVLLLLEKEDNEDEPDDEAWTLATTYYDFTDRYDDLLYAAMSNLKNVYRRNGWKAVENIISHHDYPMNVLVNALSLNGENQDGMTKTLLLEKLMGFVPPQLQFENKFPRR